MKKYIYIFSMTLFVGLFMLTDDSLEARQFRLLSPISSPEQTGNPLPDGAVAVNSVTPLPRETVEPLIREVIEEWNTSDMSDTISDQFYDKSRLLDVMDTGVPRDAKLRVQSIQGIQTLNQYIMPNPLEDRNGMVSIVSATVRTQLEFNTKAGLQKRVGTNEFILKVTRPTLP